MKRAVYENITRNFDIFEFLDENISRGGATNTNAKRNANGQAALDGDDEMSDELEFEIDDEVNHVESLYFDTDLNHNGRR